MGDFIKRGSLLLAATLAVLGSAPAYCDDLLVMPYACAVVGGRPVLTPSQNQGHRIIGAHEQRAFRACSAANPTLCRQWTIHRFDLDCNGVALPWTAVAASARPDRAWLEHGRLHIRMPPNWNLAVDDPCASGERWRYGQLQRYCADRRALTPPASVEMPTGFAPLLGIDAIFVTPSPPKSASQAVATQTPPPIPHSANSTRSEPVPVEAPRPVVSEPQPAKPPEANAAPVAAVAPAPSPAPIVPRIINRPGAVAEPPPSLPAPVVAPTEPPVTEAPVLTVSAATPLVTASNPSSSRLAVAVVAGVLVALTAGLLIFARGRGRRPAPRRAGARRPTGAAARDRSAAPAGQVPTLTPSQGSAVWSTAAAPSPVWNEDVPRTRLDALRVLGMGVTADANLAAIKKIVDGLRQTWHPDLARDPADREVREQRMKQINVAWDILGAKPAQT